MSAHQRDYYKGRAREEREAASVAMESNVAGLHEQMAEMYDELANDPDPGSSAGALMAARRRYPEARRHKLLP